MNKAYGNKLTAHLEEVVDRGMTHILWSELYRWYETPRITVGVWRDIAERWDDIADDENRKDDEKLGNLKSINGAGGIHLIASKAAKPLAT